MGSGNCLVNFFVVVFVLLFLVFCVCIFFLVSSSFNISFPLFVSYPFFLFLADGLILNRKSQKAIKSKTDGGESRDLNDRFHGISCRYSDKTSK